ncbi:MAG TPA: hypothetical protein VFU02_03815 [Polyangiaceae bacterium]|nr:hypothetical protein [Polyangiaceae bacterium]
MPSEHGGQLELEAELVRDPVTVTSWSECTNGLLIADGAIHPLRDVSARAAAGGRPALLRATASVGALIQVVKAKQKAGLVACGQKNWLDAHARRNLFALLQEFKVIADRSGTWDPSLRQEATPASTAQATPASTPETTPLTDNATPDPSAEGTESAADAVAPP